jgi:hypothetical protein
MTVHYHYYTVTIFGVCYSYDELAKCSPKLPKQWEDLGDNYVCVRPYYNADIEDCIYFLGLNVNLNISSKEMREILDKENDIKKVIKTFSEKYNLQNKENDIRLLSEVYIC